MEHIRLTKQSDKEGTSFFQNKSFLYENDANGS